MKKQEGFEHISFQQKEDDMAFTKCRKYGSSWYLCVPSEIRRNSNFPFKEGETIIIRLEKNRVIYEKEVIKNGQQKL